MGNFDLSTEEYSNLFCLIISLVIIITAITFMICLIIEVKKKATKKSSNPQEINYENEKEIIEEKIDDAKDQWQLEDMAYSIFEFYSKHKQVQEKEILKADINYLVELWQEKEESFDDSKKNTSN